MSQVEQVLQQVTADRAVGENIEALRRPLVRPLLSRALDLVVAVVLGVLVFWLGGFALDNRVLACLAIVVALAVSGWRLQRAVSARDRMWRTVIKQEAPELYEKVSTPGP